MGSYAEVLRNIQEFINRFYLRKLLQKIMVFITLEVIFLFCISSLEMWIWMPVPGRLMVFALGVLQLLFFSYILIIRTLLVIFKIKTGMSYWEASRRIGVLLPGIQDRLTNLIELASIRKQNDLIIAGIAQRSEQFKSIPFKNAISFKPLRKNGSVLILPMALYLGLLLSGQTSNYNAALNRLIHFQNEYVKPAPFVFRPLDNKDQLFENQIFKVSVTTEGEYKPQDVYLVFNGRSFLMEDLETHFETVLEPPLVNAEYYFEANGFRSTSYELKILPLPRINTLKLTVHYPEYLQRTSVSFEGSGNVEVPEGSKIEWDIATQNTSQINFSFPDSTLVLSPIETNAFQFKKTVKTPFAYSISTTNSNRTSYETLNYRVTTTPDESPNITVKLLFVDETTNQYNFEGRLSDDYGLTELSAILVDENAPENNQILNLATFNTNIADFEYNFPTGFNWVEGRSYLLYFSVRDNDGLRGGKRTDSERFSINFKNENERDIKRLELQKGILEDLKDANAAREKLINDWNKQLSRNKENASFNYQEQQRIKGLLERQKEQERLMESFTKALNQNLDKEPNDLPTKALLQERLERMELEAQKNTQLMEELQKLMQQLEPDALKEELDQFSKKQQENNRSLTQILELTKKYYVTQTARALSRSLDALAEKQQQLAEKSTGSRSEEQDSLNHEFGSLREVLHDLEKQNQALKKPLKWNRDLAKEAGIQSDQSKASDQLGRDIEKINPARANQQEAARKLKELSQDLEKSLNESSSAAENAENAKTLRQILENLIQFSVEEELLMEQTSTEITLRSGLLLKQQELRRLFEHVDDSLFALSLRQPQISESINKNISEVYYNLDQSLEQMADNQWARGASAQQYTVAASNTLAILLANILENLQESLKPGEGKGGGSNFQLPDVIQSQNQIQDQLSKALKQQSSSSGQESSSDADSQKPGNSSEPREEGEQGMDYDARFQIYQEQARIRAKLEAQLADMTSDSERNKARDVLNEMERVEQDLLSGSIDQNLLERVNRIKAKLMELEKALLKQGEGETRKSNTNSTLFTSPIDKTHTLPNQNQGKGVEILNRQTLPLRGVYKNKVKEYFDNHDRIPLRN